MRRIILVPFAVVSLFLPILVISPAQAASCVTLTRWNKVHYGDTMRQAEKKMRNGGVVTQTGAAKINGRWVVYVAKEYKRCHNFHDFAIGYTSGRVTLKVK